jgi:hypothetical protein
MLRVLVVLLLVANGVFFAWSQGWLDAFTGRARGEREPARLAEQVRPDDVKLLPPRAASAALAAAAASSCLEAGPFVGAELDAAERRLAALPPGSWTRVAGPANATLLRFEHADAALRAQVEALNAGFAPCAVRQ